MWLKRKNKINFINVKPNRLWSLLGFIFLKLLFKKIGNKTEFHTAEHFFSNHQKNLNCPKINPKKTNKTWYNGIIIINIIGKYKAYGILSLWIPIYSKTGRDKYAEVEPVMAKTIKIITSWKLLVMFQRSFSFFIYILGVNPPNCCLLVSWK